MSEFTPIDPYYNDSEGNEVRIGDMVSYVSRLSSGDTTFRTGRVEAITFKEDAVTVKVSANGKFMAASKTTAIDDSTLDGKLRLLVARSGGRIDTDAIAALVEEIGQ